MMRRYVLILLFFAVLLVPVVLRRFMVHGQSSAASGLRLVIITPDNQDIRREFARAFDRWHREKYGVGVTIDYRTPGDTGVAADIPMIVPNGNGSHKMLRDVPAAAFFLCPNE